MRDLRRRIATLGTTTSIVLVAAVVVAGPAEARRNVGGITGECVPPGNAVVAPHGNNGLGAPCICVIEGNEVLFGPNGKCPPGNDPTRKK